MPLNPNAVGAVGDKRTISWTSKDALLYAVGIWLAATFGRPAPWAREAPGTDVEVAQAP